MMNARIVLLVLLAGAVACQPLRVRERPVLQTGDRVESADDAVERARADAAYETAQAAARRDSITAAALADCAPAVCAAIARGEMALGMSGDQVLAATGTTDAAWSVRHGGAATVMVPRAMNLAPRDALGELAMVQLHGGRVSSYSYREAQGIRLVASPEDATTAGRADALAEMLIREGDDLAARGDLAAALDRYDRADVLRPTDPMLDYRIASVLDKQLRPIEALIRYQLFLHRLEIERIQARGEAAARLAEAIALAQQRIIVLERQVR